MAINARDIQGFFGNRVCVLRESTAVLLVNEGVEATPSCTVFETMIICVLISIGLIILFDYYFLLA